MFPTYSRMKDSGVKWLGVVPAHWGIKPIKHVVGLINEKAETTEGEYIGLENIEPLTGRLIPSSSEEDKEGSANLFRAADVLFGKLRPYLAKAIIAKMSGRCSSELLVLRPSGAIPSFLHYQVLSDHFIRIVDSSTYGTKMPRANWDFIGKMPVPVPDLAEQRAIASFLDRKTALIDGLIAKREHQIELLQEQRTALISRAVTKGLNPDVPMKDSGVDWLGEVPEHWGIMRLKHVLGPQKGAIKTGPFGSQLLSSEMVYGDIKVYNQKNVIGCDIDGGDNFISSEKFEELRSFEVFPGDLLITTRGTIGRCMAVPEQAKKGILHPCLMRIQLEQTRIVNRFLEILIQESGRILGQLQLMSNATTIEVIYSDSLKEVWLTVPPVSEQQAIVSFLDRETAKIDTFVTKVQLSIEKLKEYRQSLISAVVTGKIDVRGHAAYGTSLEVPA